MALGRSCRRMGTTRCSHELMEAVDSYIPAAGERQRQAVPDAGRGRILDHRKRNSSDRKSRERTVLRYRKRSRDRRTERTRSIEK